MAKKRYVSDLEWQKTECYLEIMDRVYEALGALPPSWFEDLIAKFRERALDFVESSEFSDFVRRKENECKQERC